jgi:diadenosine tetraphosphate (Ap4A) HIT family hydrolase
MVHIRDLEHSRVFLLRDQTHRGRCIVLLKQHARELFELAPQVLGGFMQEVAQVAAAITQLGHCDKVNYAIYGDLNEHIHMHLVPKTRNGPNWGQAFVLTQDRPVALPDADFQATLQKLQLLLQ